MTSDVMNPGAESDRLLAADTAMGPVTLLVSDLDAMTAWYRDAVILDVVSSTGSSTSLGRGAVPLIVLEHAPDLTHAAHASAGLFHTAILFPSRAGLAASVYSIAVATPRSFTGSADHLVSEAFYFDDPEGNGVELYWDRHRSDWKWAGGRVEMATLPLDPNSFVREHLDAGAGGSSERSVAGGNSVRSAAGGSSVRSAAGGSSVRSAAGGAGGGAPTDAGLTAGATIGHVHLAVGDVASAREFYVDRLGFETTAEFGGQALFVSAGGYHHHMAMNTWTSRGAGPRTRALGLGRVQIVVPTADDLGALGDRLAHFGIEARSDGRALSILDPWHNLITVASAS